MYVASLNDGNDSLSHRFTCQDNKNVDLAYFKVSSIVGTSPTYKIGIQTDDGNGSPSGAWLGSTWALLTPTSAGWKGLNYGSPPAMTKGDIYHFVIEYSSGTIDASNYIKILFSSPGNDVAPYNNTDDDNIGVLFNA